MYSARMQDDQQSEEQRKRTAIRRFIELDRRGLIEHDWSEANTTGLVKVRFKLAGMPSPSSSKH